MPLNQMSQTVSPSVARVLSSYIQKNSLLVESEEPILSISVILQSASNPLWSLLEKCRWK